MMSSVLWVIFAWTAFASSMAKPTPLPNVFDSILDEIKGTGSKIIDFGSSVFNNKKTTTTQKSDAAESIVPDSTSFGNLSYSGNKSTEVMAQSVNNVVSTTPLGNQYVQDILSNISDASSPVKDVIRTTSHVSPTIGASSTTTRPLSIADNDSSTDVPEFPFANVTSTTPKTSIDHIAPLNRTESSFSNNLISGFVSTSNEFVSSSQSTKVVDEDDTSNRPTSVPHLSTENTTTSPSPTTVNNESTILVHPSPYTDSDGSPKPCPTRRPGDAPDPNCKSVIAVPTFSCPEGQKIHNGKCKKIFVTNVG